MRNIFGKVLWVAAFLVVISMCANMEDASDAPERPYDDYYVPDDFVPWQGP